MLGSPHSAPFKCRRISSTLSHSWITELLILSLSETVSFFLLQISWTLEQSVSSCYVPFRVWTHTGLAGIITEETAAEWFSKLNSTKRQSKRKKLHQQETQALETAGSDKQKDSTHTDHPQFSFPEMPILDSSPRVLLHLTKIRADEARERHEERERQRAFNKMRHPRLWASF